MKSLSGRSVLARIIAVAALLLAAGSARAAPPGANGLAAVPAADFAPLTARSLTAPLEMRHDEMNPQQLVAALLKDPWTRELGDLLLPNQIRASNSKLSVSLSRSKVYLSYRIAFP